MPFMNARDFNEQLDSLTEIYRTDNEWVGRFIMPSWNNDETMNMYRDAAFTLYNAISKNQLKFIVLGGTGIRSANALIQNFGLTGANGYQETKTFWLAKEAETKRNQISRANPKAPPLPVIPVKGVGSILSEKNWTPLLNDALIVGGATARHAFQIALEPGEHAKWKGMERRCEPHLFPTDPTLNLNERHIKMRELRHKPENTRWLWRNFINDNMEMLWDMNKNIPRVLSREILGLLFLGYEPVFSSQQLGFQLKQGAPDPSFTTYVNELRRVDFQDGSKRENVIGLISEFLFEDDAAIAIAA